MLISIIDRTLLPTTVFSSCRKRSGEMRSPINRSPRRRFHREFAERRRGGFIGTHNSASRILHIRGDEWMHERRRPNIYRGHPAGIEFLFRMIIGGRSHVKIEPTWKYLFAMRPSDDLIELTSYHAYREFFCQFYCQNCNIFSVSSIFKCNPKGKTNDKFINF